MGSRPSPPWGVVANASSGEPRVVIAACLQTAIDLAQAHPQEFLASGPALEIADALLAAVDNHLDRTQEDDNDR